MEAGDGGTADAPPGDDPATPPSSPTCTPASSPVSPASDTAPADSLASGTCADRSDEYQDFLSKFGILSLPLHPGLTDDEVERVVRAVRGVAQRNG